MLPLLLFLTVGVAILGAGLRMRAKAAQAKTWPTTTGTLVDVEFDDASTQDVMTYQTNVLYLYSVSGVQYQSSRIAFGYSASRNRQAELDLYTQFKQAATVVVRYNPAMPSESTLRCEPPPSGRRLVIGGLSWIVLTIGFFVLYYLTGTVGRVP